MSTTKTTERQPSHLVQGDLLYSHLHQRLVRFLRWTPDGYAVVANRDLKELPGHVARTQIRPKFW